MKIYISHVASDDALATRAHFALVNAGFDTWVDHIHGQGPEEVVSELDEKALRHCEAQLLLMSEAALASRKCTYEWTAILKREKPLYIAVTEPIAPDDLPDRLWDQLIPYVDLQDNIDNGLAYLIHAIAGSVAHSD